MFQMNWFRKKLKVKIHTDKGQREVEIPEIWQEITTFQYQQIVSEWDGKDLIKLFSILSGIDCKVLSNSHDQALEDALLFSTRFVYEQKFPFKKDLPHEIVINDKFIVIPKDLKSLSVGQNIHVRQRLETAKVYEELISFVTAIYLQPLYDEDEFDFHRAMELEQDILKMPAFEIYPIGVFFLLKLRKSGTLFTNALNLLRVQFQKESMRRGAESQSRQELTG